MKPDLVPVFQDDIREGATATLLLDDDTQEIGVVSKMYPYAVKLRNGDGIEITILFDDIKRWAAGEYNFLRTDPRQSPPAPKHREDRQSGQQHAPSSEPIRNAETYAEPSPQKEQGKEALFQESMGLFEDKMKQAKLAPLEPSFNFTRVDHTYTVEKEVRNILNGAKQKYQTALKNPDPEGPRNLILWLEDRVGKYANVSELPALTGILLLQDNKTAEGLRYLQAAAHISGRSVNWINLAKAAGISSPLTFYAWHKYFQGSTSLGVEEDLWLNFLRSATISSQESLALALTGDIFQKVSKKEQKRLLGKSAAWLLCRLGKKEEALKLASILDTEEKPDLTASVASLWPDFNAAANTGRNLLATSAASLKQVYNEIYGIGVTPESSKEDKASGSYSHYSDLLWGKVVEFDSERNIGKLQRENSDETYSFHFSFLEDADVRHNVQNNIFTDRLCFRTFVNTYGQLLAKRIRKGLEAAYSNPAPYESAAEIEKSAKEAIHNGNREGAVTIYRQALKMQRHKDSPLLNLGLAQVLSSLGRYDETVAVYEHLINIEYRPPAKRNAITLYVYALVKANRKDKAITVLKKFLAKDSGDPILKSLLEKISASNADSLEQEEINEDWMPDLQDISPFLKSELNSAEFLDNQIVQRGGSPTPEDAERLLKASQKTVNSIENRYFAALQAAKAYSLLPLASYPTSDYSKALSNYAMLRGEVIVNRMLGIAKNREQIAKSASLLSRLRDSATSYFIESLQWMDRDGVNAFGATIIKNYILAEIINFFSSNPDKYDASLLKDQEFNDLFKRLLNANSELFSLGCAAYITWNSYDAVRSRLSQIPEGPGVFPRIMANNPVFLARVKKWIENISGNVPASSNPGIIIRAGSSFVYAEQEKLRQCFSKINALHQTGNYTFFQKANELLENFPMENKALLASDIDLIKRIKKVVKEMMSYRDASDSERTDMLVRARQGLGGDDNTLLREIAEAPSYWKRAGCEPLIRELLKCIHSMEKTRTRDRTPRLEILLEPPLFQKKDNIYSTMVRITNSSIASATETVLHFVLIWPEGKKRELPSIALGRIEANTKDTERPLLIKQDCPEEDLTGCTLEIFATFLEGQSEIFSYTIETDHGSSFEIREIPWNPMGDVPRENFMGRDEIMAKLEGYLSHDADRVFTNMLYGVTRSGKTSILKFFRQKMHGANVPDDFHERRFFCIDWQLQTIYKLSSSHVVWRQLIYDLPLLSLENSDFPKSEKEGFRLALQKAIPDPNAAHGEHFLPMVQCLKENGWYPLFLVDEFSFFRDLHKKDFLGTAFLAMLRELALRKDAAFVLAGTYDILEMVSNPDYGITGQFVNLRREPVTKIDEKSAEALTSIFEGKLDFTPEARKHITRLTGCRPFFIQFLCRNCARLALRNRRRLFGIPEVTKAAEMTVGTLDPVNGITPFEETNFDNNLIFKNDPLNSIYGAITTLLALHGDPETGFMSYNDISRRWKEHNLDVAVLAKAIEAMCAREIIEVKDDEGISGFVLTVPLFRWWWKNRHPLVDKEMDAISPN